MNASARRANAIAIWTIRGMVGILLFVLGFIVVYVIVHGFQELSRLGFYTAVPDISGTGSGVGPQLYNTMYILLLSMLLTVPVGLGAGIYFAEYAGIGRLTNLIRRATETLATLPSIVVGLFAFALFVRATGSHPSRLAAALALVVINLPYAARVSEDALRNLPQSLREGSFALGATRWQTVARVLLPAALPALITGVILIAGRAFGEAAAVLFAGAGGTVTGTPNNNVQFGTLLVAWLAGTLLASALGALVLPLRGAVPRAVELLASRLLLVGLLVVVGLLLHFANVQPSPLLAGLLVTVLGLPAALRHFQRRGPGSTGAAGLLAALAAVAGRGLAVALVVGLAGASTPSTDLFANGDTLAVNLYQFRQNANPAIVTDFSQYADGMTALLVLLVLVFNVGARGLGRLSVRRLQGTS